MVISWFSFWLDVEAVPARVSLAITTLLTLSTQANSARMALPEVASRNQIATYYLSFSGVLHEGYRRLDGHLHAVSTLWERKEMNMT